MKAPHDNKKGAKPKKLDIKEGVKENIPQAPQISQPVKPIERPQMANLYTASNASGMKVGGV